MGIRDTITALLAERQMSQRRLAELAGIDQPSLNKYLNGQTQDIMAGNLVSIAGALGVSVAYLAGESPERDAKVATVVRAMEALPDYMKDAVVATAAALAERAQSEPKE